MDRSVYEMLFVHESMVDILLDMLAGVAASFRPRGQRTFGRERHLLGLDCRIGSLTRLAEEVYRQRGMGEEVAELDGRVGRVRAAMRTASDLVEEGTNPERALKRYQTLAHVYGQLRYDGDGETGSESEAERYGRDSQEEVNANDVVEIIG